MSVQQNINDDSSGSTSTTITVTLPSVAAGDNIAVHLKYEGVVTTSSMSDGLGSTVVAKTERRDTAINDLAGRVFYILNHAGSASTVTFTITLGAARPYRVASVTSFPGSATFDAEPTGGGGEGYGGTAASGNVTTTGDSFCVAGYASYGLTSSARQINGVAADGSQEASGTTSASWYRSVTGTFTGEASATLSDSVHPWVLNLVAFKIAGGGGGGSGPPIDDDVWSTLTQYVRPDPVTMVFS